MIMELGSMLTATFGFTTLFGNIAFAVLIGTRFLARTVFEGMMRRLAPFAPAIAFFLTGASLVGSLVYSQVVGYPACILCWMTRIFMYPLPFLLALGMWRKETMIFPYAFFLAMVGALIGVYQWGKEMLLIYGHISIPCPAVSGLPSCDRIYILEYGYITIAMLALNAFLWTMVVLWAGMRYRNDGKATA